MERNSCMESMLAPKKAVEKALKRQELSSGIMRRMSVDACVGRGTSGASISDDVGLRLEEGGLGAFCADGGGAMPMLPKADVEGLAVPFGRGDDFRFGMLDCANVWSGNATFALTINCSPSSFTSKYATAREGS